MMSQGWQVGLRSFVLLLCLSACGASKPGWKTLPVPIYADALIENNPQALSDLKDGFAFWENQTGVKIFNYKGVWTGDTPFQGDPANPTSIIGNVIFFQNPWPFAKTVVGMTTVNSSESSGIESSMIMINPDTAFCTGDCLNDSRTSERRTFTHELGHFIGLSHVNDAGNIMYPTSQPGGSLSQMTVDTTALKLLVQPN